MSGESPTQFARLANALALLIALALPIGWWATLTLTEKGLIADEKDHHAYVELLTRGRWQDDSPISVLPVFHLLAAEAVYLPGASLPAVRLFSVAMAIGLVLVSALLSARFGNTAWGFVAVVVVINPFVLPYCSLVYTDVPALTLVVSAVALHAYGARWGAMSVLLLASLVRQTSLLWLPYFIACDLFVARRSSSWRELLRIRSLVEFSPYAVYLLCMLLAIWLSHTLILNKHMSNTPRLTFAQIHTFLVTVAVLWLPLWIEQFASASRGWFGRVAMHGRCWAVLATAAGIASIVFDNSHPWNGDPKYLRNQYLNLMTTSELLRLLTSALILLTAIGMVELIRRSPDRARWLVFAAACAGFIGVHWLIDPRYYMIPLSMITILAALTTRQSLSLIIWQGAISVGGCLYILRVGELHGGLW